MVLISNGSITVYSPYYDNNKTLKYKRINIPNVNISKKRVASMSDKGVEVSYITSIVIDNNYSVKEEDKIVLSSINLDIEKIKDLKDYETLTVVGVQVNSQFETIKVDCK